MALGACIGVFIVAIFGFLSAWHNQNIRPSVTGGVRGVALACLGVLIASFVFRFAATTIPQFPLLVHVKDIVGGGLLGLFSGVIVEWIGKMLKTTA